MSDKKKKENKKIQPVHITDTTLRDAHQSMWATRMRTEDILPIIDEIDKVGYYSLEVWGGATFDVCLRFLRENPWERLRQIKAHAKKTPLQMLLRGQNIVGYRNYADDVLDRFVALAHENGIDIFRIFDALNDTRNLEAAIKAVKRHGAHAQGTLAYTTSPVHTPEKYVEYAKAQVDLGIDSLVIKDMAGILSPVAAEKLVGNLVKEIDVPIQIHAHATSGMATAMYLSAVRAGAGAIDCAISSMAGFTAQPPAETLAAIFEETEFACHLNVKAMAKVAKYFEALKPKRMLKSAPSSVIDPGILVHQIPGGMISNFRSQLEQQGALDKLDEALEEVTKVRKELGYPPLVTPTSQIVGTQAVMNVLAGERYKIIPNEVKDYLRGFYGRSPAPIDKKFYKSILGDEKPIDYRPADKIEPGLPAATHGLDADLIEHEEDIISYCIFPEPSLEYFKWRKQPEDQRDPIPADLEIEAATAPVKDAVAPVKPAAPRATGMHPDQMMHMEDYRGMALLLSKAAGLSVDHFSIRKADFQMSLGASGAAPIAMTMEDDLPEAPVLDAPSAPVETPAEAPAEAPAPAAEASAYEHVITAPLVGTFYGTPGPGKPNFVKVGDTVAAGDKVCIVEAMKLFNEIEAPAAGTIVKVLVNDGDAVEKGQPLIAYDPA